MKRALLVVFFAAIAFAQRPMTVAELRGFIKSSVEAKLDDKEIANTLKKIRLTEKLESNAVSALMQLGAGPRTSAGLRDLEKASESLPAPGSAAAADGNTPARLTVSPKMVVEPDEEQQKEILLEIREYAMNYSQNLPNFICNQVTERKEDPTGTGDHYRSFDKIQEQLTYNDHQEKYKVIAVNGQMKEVTDRTKLGGAISEGEFGTMMGEIFDPDTEAEFHWDRLHTLDGVTMNAFRYHIPVERSRYGIYAGEVDRRITAGYHGVIYARQSDNAIMYITLECESIPADFPIKDVKETLWYGPMKISGREFLLPVKWESKSRDGHVLAWNTAEFHLYRKYETTSSISFGDDAADDNQKKDDKDKKDPPPVKKP